MSNPLQILCRCDGSPEIGLGHVARCLALAEIWRAECGSLATFAMRPGPLGLARVRDRGFPVWELPPVDDPVQESRWLAETVQRQGIQVLVLDVRDDLPAALVSRIRSRGVLVATLDDPSERRLAADLAFYPPVPQVRRLDWTGFTGELHVGWEWVVLDRAYGQHRPKVPGRTMQVLVTMGGSDPAALTLKALRALELLEDDFETLVVLGPGFSHNQDLDRLLAITRRRYQVLRHVTNMQGLMGEVDLAVAAFGVTAFELAAMGVPAIHLGLTPDHAESASALAAAGMALSLGVYQQVSDVQLAASVSQLLADASRRSAMAARAQETIDGRGGQRIAQLVASHAARRSPRRSICGSRS
ncbi:MAG: PseG/SpsG family protein [Desulfobaccales bacterium]